MLSNSFFAAGNEVAGKELDELIFHVLDEVESALSILLHDEHCQETTRHSQVLPVWLFYAAVQHFDEDAWILGELDHELLSFVHLLEPCLVNHMRIMEE